MEINRKIGVSCVGFIAEQNREVIASATTFDGLINKKTVLALLGDKSLVIKHIVPKGTIRIY